MDLIKKNLVFFIIVALSALIFIGGAALALLELNGVGQARNQVQNAEAQLTAVLNSSVAPTIQNVEASKANVQSLARSLAGIRENLEAGAELVVSSDGIGVMASIQQYIASFRSAADNHTNSEGEAKSIETPVNFAFGFDEYVDETSIDNRIEITPILDKQRQILDYALKKLIAADPVAIDSVLRESPEVVLGALDESPAKGKNGRAAKKEDQSFRLKPPVSARVPGAIDTLAFSITFTSYTETLRAFLNDLAEFELPLVVRSIEVERPSGSKTTTDSAKGANDLDAVFGIFGDNLSSSQEVTGTIKQKPVVENTVSSFTVIFEFIDIVLPDLSEAETV